MSNHLSEEHASRLLRRDLEATTGDAHAALIEHAIRVNQELDIDAIGEKLVADVQQAVHDQFVDSNWPACPVHQRHPLWFHDGACWCDQTNTRIAALGELSSSGNKA